MHLNDIKQRCYFNSSKYSPLHHHLVCRFNRQTRWWRGGEFDSMSIINHAPRDTVTCHSKKSLLSRNNSTRCINTGTTSRIRTCVRGYICSILYTNSSHDIVFLLPGNHGNDTIYRKSSDISCPLITSLANKQRHRVMVLNSPGLQMSAVLQTTLSNTTFFQWKYEKCSENYSISH